MSLIKKKHEIEAIRKACQIDSNLHMLAMCSKTVGLTEHVLIEKLIRFYKLSEAEAWAYPILVGSGNRTTIIHAKPTQKKVREDELILIDMGVKYAGMCSDITRTWHAGARFTQEQKMIYKIVLKTQNEVIKKIKAGSNLPELHELAKNVMLDELLSKGAIRKNEISDLFPHRTSHWIGRVVHDTPTMYFYKDGSPVELAAGQCFTVEPGLYFKNKKSKYFGIGVRIEDVVLVTEDGCEVLSCVPKEVEQIEDVRSRIEK